MTDAAETPFTLVGDPTAAACEGDFCVLPNPAEAAQAEVLRRIDEDVL